MRSLLEISRVFAAALVAAALAGCTTRLPQTTDDDDDAGADDTAGATSDDTGVMAGPHEVCTRWVACSAAIDPDTDMAGMYGADGSCWQGDEDAQAGCLKFCDGQLQMYASAFPDEPACSVAGLSGSTQFALGAAVFDPNDPLAEPTYRALVDGDELTIVRGGQGLLMLPFGVRGRGFEVPPDPNAWDDPKMPTIDLWVDIDGYNDGFGGHFARLNAYPIGFVPRGDSGMLEHMYIAIIVPDAVEDPQVLVDQHGVVHAELHTYMQPTVTQELRFVVAPEIQEM